MLRVNTLSGFGRIIPAAGGGGAGPTIEGVGAVEAVASGNCVPVNPTHLTDDILICVARNGSASATMTITGWTEITQVDTGIQVKWWWKRAASGAEANPTIVPSAGAVHAIVYAVRSCITSGTPFEDATSRITSGDATIPKTAAIDTVGVDRLAACFAARWGESTWSVAPPPSTWEAEVDGSSAVGSGSRFTAISKQIPTAANVPAVDIGTYSTGSSFWGSLTLAFIPA